MGAYTPTVRRPVSVPPSSAPCSPSASAPARNVRVRAANRRPAGDRVTLRFRWRMNSCTCRLRSSCAIAVDTADCETWSSSAAIRMLSCRATSLK